VPKGKELSVFRMKNTAHHSIDYPKGESEEYQNRQAIALIRFDCEMHLNKSPIQKKNNETEWVVFIPEIDHEIVMN